MAIESGEHRTDVMTERTRCLALLRWGFDHEYELVAKYMLEGVVFCDSCDRLRGDVVKKAHKCKCGEVGR